MYTINSMQTVNSFSTTVNTQCLSATASIKWSVSVDLGSVVQRRLVLAAAVA